MKTSNKSHQGALTIIISTVIFADRAESGGSRGGGGGRAGALFLDQTEGRRMRHCSIKT